MTLLHRTLALSAALAVLAGPALAAPVTLKANPVDDDGRVTSISYTHLRAHET